MILDFHYRKPCAYGDFWVSHGYFGNGQMPLVPCTCGTHQSCRFCGEAHMWIARCELCCARKVLAGGAES